MAYLTRGNLTGICLGLLPAIGCTSETKIELEQTMKYRREQKRSTQP
ncbi:hypothetical protein [uncultured Gimesia sp.]